MAIFYFVVNIKICSDKYIPAIIRVQSLNY